MVTGAEWRIGDKKSLPRSTTEQYEGKGNKRRDVRTIYHSRLCVMNTSSIGVFPSCFSGPILPLPVSPSYRTSLTHSNTPCFDKSTGHMPPQACLINHGDSAQSHL